MSRNDDVTIHYVCVECGKSFPVAFPVKGIVEMVVRCPVCSFPQIARAALLHAITLTGYGRIQGDTNG